MIEDEKPRATRAGPNRSDALFPPGCGPMELVYAVSECGITVLGHQNDSFHMFATRKEAADWLRTFADRVENEDVRRGSN